MSIDEFCTQHDTTRSEERELRWYLAYLRWRKTVEHLIGLDA